MTTVNTDPNQSDVTIRHAAAADAPAVLRLIDALADYEQLDRPTDEARERLIHDGFVRNPPRFEVFLAEDGDTAIGYMIVFETYSSFLARPTLYIEDLFVLPDARKKGAGCAFFTRLMDEARQRGCGRIEWVCLDWNLLAIDFYEKRGAEHLKEWRVYRMTDAVFNPAQNQEISQP